MEPTFSRMDFNTLDIAYEPRQSLDYMKCLNLLRERRIPTDLWSPQKRACWFTPARLGRRPVPELEASIASFTVSPGRCVREQKSQWTHMAHG